MSSSSLSSMTTPNFRRPLKYGLLGACCALFVVQAIPVILNSFGFNEAKITKGSWAAAWQSLQAQTAKGSLFSICQSTSASGVSLVTKLKLIGATFVSVFLKFYFSRDQQSYGY